MLSFVPYKLEMIIQVARHDALDEDICVKREDEGKRGIMKEIMSFRHSMESHPSLCFCFLS